MAKKCDDSVLEGLLSVVITANECYLNTAEPTDRANAIATSVIGAATPTYSGFVNGDTSGRKVTVQALNGLSATGTGTVNHVSLSTATLLLYVTTCTAQAVTDGNTVNIGAWDIEVADPT